MLSGAGAESEGEARGEESPPCRAVISIFRNLDSILWATGTTQEFWTKEWQGQISILDPSDDSVKDWFKGNKVGVKKLVNRLFQCLGDKMRVLSKIAFVDGKGKAFEKHLEVKIDNVLYYLELA